MCCYKYDALLEIEENRYKETVLSDIEEIYTPMIFLVVLLFGKQRTGKRFLRCRKSLLRLEHIADL